MNSQPTEQQSSLADHSVSDAYGLVCPKQRCESGRGRRVLSEVLFSSLLFSAILAFGAGMCGARHIDTGSWRQAARANHLVDEAMDALAAYSFEAVSRLDGSCIHDHATAAASDYRVDLAVTPAAEGLLQIKAVLLDNRTSREITRFVTWRGRS